MSSHLKSCLVPADGLAFQPLAPSRSCQHHQKARASPRVPFELCRVWIKSCLRKPHLQEARGGCEQASQWWEELPQEARVSSVTMARTWNTIREHPPRGALSKQRRRRWLAAEMNLGSQTSICVLILHSLCYSHKHAHFRDSESHSVCKVSV